MIAKGLLACCVVVATLFAQSASAQTIPSKPTGYINDFTQTLSPETKQQLETELSGFQASTTNQIAVAIVQNLDGDYIENYAVKLFANWGIGTETKDNGVLLVIALDERELRIEVGYGLEGALPDSLAQKIIDNDIVPYLKTGDYNAAVISGVRAIQAATQGEYTADASPLSNTVNMNWLFKNAEMLFFAGIVIFQWLAAMLARSKSWWAGGVFGLLGGIGIGWVLALGATAIALIAAPLALLGLLLDYLVSNAYKNAKSHGATPPWWTGGGGFGSGSGGRGFGGFGGGMSGGGGASGRW
jgi:uncharacterized protein